MSAFIPGVLDIRWDDPTVLGGNAAYTIVGVNVYRSDVSDRGPFYRINDLPVGASFYRDQTENIFISREIVNWNSDWVFKADAPNDRRWEFRTKFPIVKKDPLAPYQKPTPANAPTDVTVYVDGVEVPVDTVFGPSGDIKLLTERPFDVVIEKFTPIPIPTETSIVEVSYYTNRNRVRSGLDASIHYRLTTVALSSTDPSGYVESELAWCPPISTTAVEALDYIWREAIRRNQWILQQGGERVKVFIRRQSGVPCTCNQDPVSLEFNGQPSNRCLQCYGTGFVGGYEGPYSTIIAPDDAERRIAQLSQGRRKEHTYEVWTGPSPVLTQRDFIVKQTNERYSIGPVRRPSNRGNLLQQHFNIAYLDEGDIRYKVPIDGTSSLPWPETRYSFRQAPSLSVDGEGYRPPSIAPDRPPFPTGPDAETPMGTDKDGWDKSREQRGRSPVWENQNE
jgi:hypothetical protein